MLGANQTSMDGTTKTGKVLMDKSPQDDAIAIECKIADLKTRWDAICALSVERLALFNDTVSSSRRVFDARIIELKLLPRSS